MFGVPAYGNLRSLGKLTQYADIRRSYASQIAGALSGKNKQIDGGRLLVVKESRRGLKPNAIYRVKGNSVIRLFSLLKEEPTLPVALPYERFVKQTAEQRLPSLLSLQLQRAMTSR